MKKYLVLFFVLVGLINTGNVEANSNYITNKVTKHKNGKIKTKVTILIEDDGYGSKIKKENYYYFDSYGRMTKHIRRDCFLNKNKCGYGGKTINSYYKYKKINNKWKPLYIRTKGYLADGERFVLKQDTKKYFYNNGKRKQTYSKLTGGALGETLIENHKWKSNGKKYFYTSTLTIPKKMRKHSYLTKGAIKQYKKTTFHKNGKRKKQVITQWNKKNRKYKYRTYHFNKKGKKIKTVKHK